MYTLGPHNSTLRYIPNKAYIHHKTYTKMVIALLVIIDNIWKQCKCSSTVEISMTEYNTALKVNELRLHKTHE